MEAHGGLGMCVPKAFVAARTTPFISGLVRVV